MQQQQMKSSIFRIVSDIYYQTPSSTRDLGFAERKMDSILAEIAEQVTILSVSHSFAPCFEHHGDSGWIGHAYKLRTDEIYVTYLITYVGTLTMLDGKHVAPGQRSAYVQCQHPYEA